VDRVRFVGEAVAAVVAEDPYAAYDALEAVKVDYEILAATTDPEQAAKPDAPQLHEGVPNNLAFRWRFKGGNVDEAFSQADHVIRERIVYPRIVANALEPRAAVAQYNRSTGELTLWVTSQNPHILRLLISPMLGIPENKLRVVTPDMGAAFGSKSALHPYEVVVSWIAMDLGRPVKWVPTKGEDFLFTIHAKDRVEHVEIAVKRDGTVLGLRVKTYAAMGAYLSTITPGILTWPFAVMLCGPYKFKAVESEVLGVFTNATPIEISRGTPRPEVTWVIERAMDLVARRLKMDPAEVRRKNLIEKAPYTAPTGVVYDSGEYRRVFEQALQAIDYDTWRKEQQKAFKDGRLLGIGISSFVEMTGWGPSKAVRAAGFDVGQWESALVRVHPSGKVNVYSGSSPHGQGEGTAFAQIAADELWISMDDVEIVYGDTSNTPFGLGTYENRTTATGGAAITRAARKVMQKAKKIAAALLEASEDDLVYKQGRFYVKGVPERGVSFAEVAAAAYTADKLPPGVEPGLEDTGFYDPENFTFTYGTHACVAEIDKETGAVKILKYLAVVDAGTIVNPTLAEGQVHGGVAEGISTALYQGLAFDSNGTPLAQGFNDYVVPRAEETPWIETQFVQTPAPQNPLGIKGIGTQTPAAVPCVVNTVIDAFSQVGVDHIDMPLLPSKVASVLRDKGL